MSGRYYFRTPEGKEVDVSYDAGPKGYQARGEAIPGGAAPPLDQQEEQGAAPVQQEGDVRPQLQRGEGFSSPYGALLLTDVQETRPVGEGNNNNNIYLSSITILSPSA